MVSISVEITKDTATPALRRMREGLSAENLIPRFGRAVNNEVRDNFDYLESTRPNQMGGQRTHYYGQARQKTSFTTEGNSAIVHIRQVGMRLRYYGGTVSAGVNPSATGGGVTQYLTIPATPEAYGHRAADFDDLEVLRNASGPYALGRRLSGFMAGGKRARSIARAFGTRESAVHKTEILFWLKKQVTIHGDETMLPTSEDMKAAIRDVFSAYVNGVWRGRAAATYDE